jgi:GAF domain-containing protein
MQDREEWLADTLVGLADTLTTDFDVIEFLSTLAERLVELLDAAEVGLVLADPQGHLRVMAASTERMHMLDLFEVQTSEGPCLDCYRSGDAVFNVELDRAEARWPVFTPMVRSAGFRAVHALAMRLRDQVIGAVNIFHTTTVAISERDIHLAQALADVATIGLLQQRAVRHASELSEQLQRALTSRVVIEHAKGAVAERAAVDMDTAFGWLRGYARANNRRLADVAIAVVERTLAVDALRARSTSPPGVR